MKVSCSKSVHFYALSQITEPTNLKILYMVHFWRFSSWAVNFLKWRDYVNLKYRHLSYTYKTLVPASQGKFSVLFVKTDRVVSEQTLCTLLWESYEKMRPQCVANSGFLSAACATYYYHEVLHFWIKLRQIPPNHFSFVAINQLITGHRLLILRRRLSITCDLCHIHKYIHIIYIYIFFFFWSRKNFQNGVYIMSATGIEEYLTEYQCGSLAIVTGV
jgi:hypothetical protein